MRRFCSYHFTVDAAAAAADEDDDNDDDDGDARTLRVSADELKAETDKMSQEHNTAAKQLTEHAQTFAEFVEQQRKNRAKVFVSCSLFYI